MCVCLGRREEDVWEGMLSDGWATGSCLATAICLLCHQ